MEARATPSGCLRPRRTAVSGGMHPRKDGAAPASPMDPSLPSPAPGRAGGVGARVMGRPRPDAKPGLAVALLAPLALAALQAQPVLSRPAVGVSDVSPVPSPPGRATLLAQGQAGWAVETVIVTQADDGRTLNLRRGERLRVVLPDIAGTGYSWEIEGVDPRLLRPEGQRTWQDPGPPPAPGVEGVAGLVGGPLQISFLFRAVAPGRTELRLRHWRPWEGAGSVDRRFTLQLRIAG